jgi:hypothetical protein
MKIVDDDERKLYKIENYSVSKISQVKLSFFSIFLIFQKTFFQILSGEGRGVGQDGART